MKMFLTFGTLSSIPSPIQVSSVGGANLPLTFEVVERNTSVQMTLLKHVLRLILNWGMLLSSPALACCSMHSRREIDGTSFLQEVLCWHSFKKANVLCLLTVLFCYAKVTGVTCNCWDFPNRQKVVECWSIFHV